MISCRKLLVFFCFSLQRHSIGTTSVQYAHWFLKDMSEEANQVITAICEEQCMLNYKVHIHPGTSCIIFIPQIKWLWGILFWLCLSQACLCKGPCIYLMWIFICWSIHWDTRNKGPFSSNAPDFQTKLHGLQSHLFIPEVDSRSFQIQSLASPLHKFSMKRINGIVTHE